MQCDVFRGSCVPRLRRRCSCAGARQGLCRGAPHGIVPAGGLRTAPRRGAHSGSQAWGQGLKQHFFFLHFGVTINLKSGRVCTILPGLAGLGTWLLAGRSLCCLRLCIYFN